MGNVKLTYKKNTFNGRYFIKISLKIRGLFPGFLVRTDPGQYPSARDRSGLKRPGLLNLSPTEAQPEAQPENARLKNNRLNCIFSVLILKNQKSANRKIIPI